ncbi:putative large secreted protein [Gimesia maris DSM 8797]|uniref:Intein C-terminal splicing domain-containing protein n=2 Tax=Gimesia maris TaxID=122 RepID=A0ABX5YPR1_9PLAN|nr:putative large secreted protein [Gimesia maris DSM 8797]QEG17542.1 hypothetical protein GmarT_34240 [Gimesia maris]
MEEPTVAASAHEKRAQPSSPTGEYKLKSVAEFKVGDTIMALNHETGQREQKTVKQTFQRQVDHLRILEVKSEDGSTRTIKTTDEHPFWVPSADEYVEAKQLTPGTKLTGANGHFITVTSTRHEPYPEGVTVYNVEVEGFHNYFVAANGYRGPPVLAHNKCNTSKHSKALGQDLTNNKIPRPQGGYQAAHIVPTNNFSKRSQSVQNAIKTAQKKFNTYLGKKLRDTNINGFWAKAGHAGTHTDEYFLELGKAFQSANSKDAVEKALTLMWKRIEAGEFIQ